MTLWPPSRNLERNSPQASPPQPSNGHLHEADTNSQNMTKLAYNTSIRHGFDMQYFSENYMKSLAEVFFIYFDDDRHESAANPKRSHSERIPDWRIRDRQRTVNAAIVLCLNLGVDPPDVIKTQPCAKMEAWIDPAAVNDGKKALELIGKNLQSQYESLSTRTKYKQSLDPNVEDAKRFCISLRRSARDERILFHYNGHGVPRPTSSGEIWVFNRGYTQYIPVSLYDLQTWLGAPCIYAFDCHSAGHIVTNFNAFVQRRKEDERKKGPEPNMPPAASFDNCILLASCREDEQLPMHPELPADLFTCCITSPIDIAVKWFVMQSPLFRNQFDVLTIPGKLTDRRTPLGELNWIFTAITDTIAWSTLESPLFKRLFRQDLVVAAMFRNFLLAVRIMRVHNCHPVSSPSLPDTHDHPMWNAWDLAVDHFLVQLPKLQEAEKNKTVYIYEHSDFFEQQLVAFEVWLKYKSSDLDKPPEQLPVLLQVLLSQMHRLRALILLSNYLDLGPKAVHLALSIGIFPYVLKLLQSPAPELKPVLVFIWARIMAVDYMNIQNELIKENGYAYFLNIYIPSDSSGPASSNQITYENLAMCAFVTALFCRGYRQGQRLCMGADVLKACLKHCKETGSPRLRQWSCLLLSQLWDEFPEARRLAMQENVFESLLTELEDTTPEVRTACIVALTTFLGGGSLPNASSELRDQELQLAVAVLALTNDGSSVVRREVVVFFSKFVKSYLSFFLVTAFSSLEDEVAAIKHHGLLPGVDGHTESPASGTIYTAIWRTLLVLSEDPFLEVADFARDVVDYVYIKLHKTGLASSVDKLESYLLRNSSMDAANLPELSSQNAPQLSNGNGHRTGTEVSIAQHPKVNGTSPATRAASASADYRLSDTLKRSVSFAATLKNFAWSTAGYESPSPNGTPQKASSQNGRGWAEYLDDKPAVTRVKYGTGLKPPTAMYRNRDYTKKIVLPLVSGFFEWSCETYQEPQMKQSESDEPGSEKYVERVWRNNRNERIISETQVQKESALYGTWSTQIAFLNNITQPTKLVFSQFEPHMVSADEGDGVTVWDWTEGTKLNRFCNRNPRGTHITELKLINEDDTPLMLSGSSDGVIRIYRNYQSMKSVSLSCAWRALTDMVPASHSSGLVAEWQQCRGTLLVGGDVRVVRVWDAPREVCTQDIPARSGSPVTSLTSDQVAGDVIVAGFGDGVIRVYDRRQSARDSLVKVWRGHESRLVNVHMQRGGARELVSGSEDGQVHLWDIRGDSPVLSFQAHAQSLRAMNVHEHAPVIATGCQTVGIWSTAGNRMSSVQNTGIGLLGNRAVPVSTLSFHPHRMVLAVSNVNDPHISVFNCDDSTPWK